MGFLKEKYKKEIDYSNNLAKQIDAHTDKFSEVFDSFPKEAVVELYNIQAEKDENMMKIYSKAEAEIFRPVIDSKDNEHFSYDDDFYVMKDDGTFFSGNAETILNKFVDIDDLKEFVMESCRENVPVLLIIRKYSEWADEFDRLMNDWEYYSQIPLKVCLFDKILEG
jgi:hypothetical protein